MQSSGKAAYDLLGELGRGAFGIVNKAKHIESGRIVAIKQMLLQGQSSGKDIPLEAIREIKMMNELDHPNVLKLRDVFADDSTIHLVLDLAPNDLERVINDKSASGVLSQADVKQCLLQILTGLEYLHKRWVLHRVTLEHPVVLAVQAATSPLKQSHSGTGLQRCYLARRDTAVPWISGQLVAYSPK